jgi:uncharacterized membrane protein YhfC
MKPEALPQLWIASGLVVMVGAASACAAFQRRRGARWRDYSVGALGITLAVILKVLAAVALFGALSRFFGGRIPFPVSSVASGLLTGVFEVGLALLMVRATSLRHASWSSALAFGLGFGCFEAGLLGLLAVLRGALGLLLPFLDGLLSPGDLAEIARGMGGWHEPFVLILERIVAVPVHVLACALVVLAVQRRQPGLFWAAFWFKSAIDAVPARGLPEPVLQAVYLVFGLAAWWTLLRLDERFRVQPSETREASGAAG